MMTAVEKPEWVKDLHDDHDTIKSDYKKHDDAYDSVCLKLDRESDLSISNVDDVPYRWQLSDLRTMGDEIHIIFTGPRVYGLGDQNE